MANNNLWLRLRSWVQRLFGVAAQQSNDALDAAELDAQKYFDITGENITAIIANSLSVLAFGDSDISITAPKATVLNTGRLETLEKLLKREWTSAKRNISAALGVGMIATIPYSVDTDNGKHKIYTSTVTRDRIYITGMQGSDITSCVILADVFEDGVSAAPLFRWTAYSVEGNVYTIRNKATQGGDEIPLTSVPRWASIPEEVSIAGVERLPLGIFRCPTANRRPDDITGVPITFGCDATLHKIAQTLADIETEFDRKKVRVFADRQLLRPIYNDKGIEVGRELADDVFAALGESDTPVFNIYDPALRESAYFAKLQQHFALLEREVGASRGLLTELDTKNATATEIRRAMHDTFCLLDDIHGEYERYIDQLMYGINVLCNYYGIEADTAYELHFDWSYALLEDSAETYRQLSEGHSAGIISDAEMRVYLKPDEDLDTAQKRIDEIRKTRLVSPTLLGMVGNDAVPED